jgi:ketosteroid isomerase-like protein
MTLTGEKRARSAATAAEVVREFFDSYRRQDVNAMVDLCAPNADFSYLPYEIWRKQIVLRGDG